MNNFLLTYFNKDFKSIRNIQTIEELKDWIANEELLDRKNHNKKLKNNRMRLLDFNKNYSKEESNSELFLIFSKIFSMNITAKAKEGFLVRVLNLYSESVSKEEILLFLTSFWHIIGSTWHDFNFLFVLWLKYFKTDLLELTEKSIELIWFQDAVLNINTEQKFVNFLLELPDFITLISVPYYLLSEALSLINKKPDHFKDEEFIISEKIINLTITQFCRHEDTLLEKIYIDLLSYMVDTVDLANIDHFTTILRSNLISWLKKGKTSLIRFLYFIHQTWQKRLLSYSHFLEFTFYIGQNIPKRENNLYVNYILNLYQQSFLQINQAITLLNDPKILAFLSFKTKRRVFEAFESKTELFFDLEFLELYFKLKKSFHPKIRNLNNYFHIAITNEPAWESLISYYIVQDMKRKKYLFNSLLNYFNSDQYNIQFNNLAEKFFKMQEKLIHLASSLHDELQRFYIFEKMFMVLEKDERYASLISSFVLNCLDLFNSETLKSKLIKKLNDYVTKLNPLTMNANYYRMFLRDTFKIAQHCDFLPLIKEELNRKLDLFLESYILYSDYLIPDREKIEFLEYLTIFDLTDDMTAKIMNWVKNQPNVNVKILTTMRKSPKINQSILESTFSEEIHQNEIKCGSCLREIEKTWDKKSCEHCGITLCLTCFVEFEFSGEQCPGVLFGNKMHKFKVKKT